MRDTVSLKLNDILYKYIPRLGVVLFVVTEIQDKGYWVSLARDKSYKVFLQLRSPHVYTAVKYEMPTDEKPRYPLRTGGFYHVTHLGALQETAERVKVDKARAIEDFKFQIEHFCNYIKEIDSNLHDVKALTLTLERYSPNAGVKASK